MNVITHTHVPQARLAKLQAEVQSDRAIASEKAQKLEQARVVIKTAKAQVAAAERRAEQAEQVHGNAESFVEICVSRKG